MAMASTTFSKQKRGYQSIVTFRADVVNRWGKRVAHWSHPAEGWDGKSGGADAPEGAYYLTVTARGADGRKYDNQKDHQPPAPLRCGRQIAFSTSLCTLTSVRARRHILHKRLSTQTLA